MGGRLAYSHARCEIFLTHLLLQFVDGTLISVGAVIMGAASFLEGEGLFDTGLHVVVIFQFLVVKDQTAFPQRADGFDAGELVRLLPHVGGDGHLVAALPALTLELVQYGILHEVGFHVDGDGGVLGQ